MRNKEKEISDIREIESIISCADVCRIALANDNIPYIVTMNFGYSGGNNPQLFFHCATEGRKLEMIGKNNYVCFEMDTDHEIYTGNKSCEGRVKYSSVVGYGYIFIVQDEDEKRKGLDLLIDHYREEEEHIYDVKVFERTSVLRLDIKEMTGKKSRI